MNNHAKRQRHGKQQKDYTGGDSTGGQRGKTKETATSEHVTTRES